MNTDKEISGLDLVYKKLLAKYKFSQVSLLEIGVWKGGSLLMYQKMLPNAKIYGIDILPRPEILKDVSIITRVIDQNDSPALEGLANEVGGFDIIIDDGTHFEKETRNSFDTLWKHLKKGGIYVIEDWAVAVKEKDSPNIVYSTAVAGMDKLVVELASRAVELGMSSADIHIRNDWQSYAVYKK